MSEFARFKSLALGRRLARQEAVHQLLPKRYALPVFASDPLSSVAYATEESMLVLALAGSTAFHLITPVSLAVATLLVIVILSYRQTIRAYPDGGGAFIVASENIGLQAGAIAAASLLVDYTLTVAVSVAAGVAAITSAAPSLLGHRVLIALIFIVLLTLANLRGVREASRIFALPTYLFIATIMVLLATGFLRCATGQCPQAVTANVNIVPAVSGLGVFLILRAFASGATALTGVEAIANGVQAFREPKAKNAATTLTAMGIVAVTMFLGISTLARLFNVRVTDTVIAQYGTVLSQLGRAAFHGGAGFYILQVATAAILVLAANTAYQDFPRLSAILSEHRLMPRQFRNRGDRLVFSNGVLTVAFLAGLLIVVFDGEVTRLIQLYVVGVFTSFTLSQAGMVRHWLKSREPGWRHSVVINAVGAVTTGVVLVVIAAVKFSHGAWIVVVAVPIIVTLMHLVRRHYLATAQQLREIPRTPTALDNRVILTVGHTDEATDRALAYAELIATTPIECIHAEQANSDEVVYAWERIHPDESLTVLPGRSKSVSGRIAAHACALRDANPGSWVTVVMSERLRRQSMWEVIRRPRSIAIRARLIREPHIAVTDLPRPPARRKRGIATLQIHRVETVVLVADLTRPVREALAYAMGLGAPVAAVHIDVDEQQRERVERDWEKANLGIPLEMIPSPYRSIIGPLVQYLRARRRDSLPGTIINVVIPEFIVPGRITQLLHNQTGLAIKGVLTLERGVAVTSVPFHLSAASQLHHETAEQA
jgi:amino acid transporter